MPYKYQITKAYGVRGPEVPIAELNELNDARALIQLKLTEDKALRLQNVIYRLVEMGEVIEVFDPSKLEVAASSGTQQQGSTQVFSPTPLANAPRPGGLPPSSFRDIKKDESKDKK